MSYTSIYRLGARGVCLGDIRNSWRSGMYVWNDISKRYFGLDSFPIFDDTKRSEIWNANNRPDMPIHDKIVLLSTMDKAVICGKYLPHLVEAFEKYGAEHEVSSFIEQAKMIQDAKVSNKQFIAWQQTSCGEFWGEEYQGNKHVFYNPLKGNKHFDLYEEVEELLK